MATVVFSKDSSGVEMTPEKFEENCYKAVCQIFEKARQNARNEAPVLLGRLTGQKGGYGGISYRVIRQGGKIVGILTATARNPESGKDYAVLVHSGTGLYGPKKKRIYPKKKGGVLVFMTDAKIPRPKTMQAWKEARDAGHVVYAKSSKGMKPNPFAERGLKSALKEAEAIFDRIAAA
ncbi:MAG: hypothetical protein GY765_05390 [bacterium]|nr:hypothetical protein [bacterium]